MSAGQAKRKAASAAAEQRGFGNWLRAIGAWFVFVHRRRVDPLFPLSPGARRSMAALVLGAASIAAAFLFLDPIFAEAMRAGNTGPRTLFGLITRIGQSGWVLYGAGALLIGLSLVKSRRLAGDSRLALHNLLLGIYFLFTSVAFSGLLTNLMKTLIGRARPPFAPAGELWFSSPFRGNYQFASFPSGHATTAGALLVALSLLFPRLRWFFVLTALLIVVSRPVLTVHYPSDVVAGLLFGAAFTYVYARSFARKRLLFCRGPDGRMALRPPLPFRLASLRSLFAPTGKIGRT